MSYGLVVDDHPLVARGVTGFLRAHPRLSDAVDAGDAEQARAILAERGMPAIVLIAFWLGNDTAQAVIAHLLVTFHGARVLVMSGDDRPGVRATAMHTGAHGIRTGQGQCGGIQHALGSAAAATQIGSEMQSLHGRNCSALAATRRRARVPASPPAGRTGKMPGFP